MSETIWNTFFTLSTFVSRFWHKNIEWWEMFDLIWPFFRNRGLIVVTIMLNQFFNVLPRSFKKGAILDGTYTNTEGAVKQEKRSQREAEGRRRRKKATDRNEHRKVLYVCLLPFPTIFLEKAFLFLFALTPLSLFFLLKKECVHSYICAKFFATFQCSTYCKDPSAYKMHLWWAFFTK